MSVRLHCRAGRASCVSLVLLAGAGVRAGEAPSGEAPVVVAVERCPALSEAALRGLLRVEIGGLLRARGAAADGEADHLIVTCAGGRAELAAEARGGGPRLARSVALADCPADARPRLVALAAIELLAAVNPEVRRRVEARTASAPPPIVGAPPPAAAAPVTVAQAGSGPAPVSAAQAGPVAPAPIARGAAVGTLLLLGAGRRVFLAERGLATWGAGLRWERALAPWGGFALDGDVGGSRNDVDGGAVTGVVGSAAGALWLERALAPRLVLRGGGGARVGFARLAGRPSDPVASGHAVVRPWGGPCATLALTTAGRFSAQLAVEGGYAVIGARGLAGDALAAAVTGAWVGVALAAGLGR